MTNRPELRGQLCTQFSVADFCASAVLRDGSYRNAVNAGSDAACSVYTSLPTGRRIVRGDLDQAGNLYGTTYYGTPEPFLSSDTIIRAGSFEPLYYFQLQNDGHAPFAPVVFGPDGALYGTTIQGGYEGYLGKGTVFSVQPSPNPCRSVICLRNEIVSTGLEGSITSTTAITRSPAR